MISAVLLAAATANTCLTNTQDNFYRYCTDDSDIDTVDKVNGATLCAPYASGYPCCVATFSNTNNNLESRECWPDLSGQACESGNISIEIEDGFTTYATECDGNLDASLTPATTSTTTATTTVVSPPTNTGPSSGAVVGIVVGGVLGPFLLGGIYGLLASPP